MRNKIKAAIAAAILALGAGIIAGGQSAAAAAEPSGPFPGCYRYVSTTEGPNASTIRSSTVFCWHRYYCNRLTQTLPGHTPIVLETDCPTFPRR
jgi:hypothetical protein